MSKLEAVGVNSEQIKSKDLTRTKIIRDFLKKDMEYIRLLKSFEKVCCPNLEKSLFIYSLFKYFIF